MASISEISLPEELTESAPLSKEEIVKNFSDEVARSREILSSAKADAAPKKRGRPRKNSLVEAGGGSQAMPESPLPSQVASAPPPLPPAVLALALQCPFLIAEKRTGFEGFKLNDDELAALVPQLDAVCKQYMPMINSPHAALTIFGLSLATVAVTKYMIYLDHVNTLENQKKPEKIEEINPEKPF